MKLNLGDRPRILLIRRDNIGDLVCTTPLFDALRSRYPQAYLAALANSYNAEVITGNPALDKVYVYTKAKHRAAGSSKLAVYWQTFHLIMQLRREHFDIAIPVGGGWHRQAIKFARLAGAKQVLGFGPEDGKLAGVDVVIPYHRRETRHEVEDIFRLLEPLGISGQPGPLRIYPDTAALAAMKERFAPLAGRVVLGVHISAREANRRWPEDKFIAALQQLCAQFPRLGIALFWAPGAADDPRHPGDDELAVRMQQALAGLPVLPVPTGTLAELIAALACTDLDLLSDGGALHIAAALQKPLAALFENRVEKLTRWYPWATPHRMIAAPENAIAGISVADVVAATSALLIEHFPQARER
ncbi:glycosyltransferase family 9 protein [Chitinilyticum aquatile]|uniref:glycosyltransferase family 9 protein n=1 Tax=Chitinilyticum aquatile TaxID=362520 RepID=UPI00040AD4A7|nr:glycosyltransferase family 9 protein [Chitinilyticum aquatile]